MERNPNFRPAVVNYSFEQQRNQAQEQSQVLLRECTVSTVVVCDPENVESPEEWENQQYLPPPRSRRSSSSLNRNRTSSERDIANSPSCHRASVTLSASESAVSTSTEASNYVIRTSQATLRERNASMLCSDLMADVWFLVGSECSLGGQKRIPAHTYVLATGSTVFYAMFFGGFSKNAEIPIPDVEPEAFKIMLRYLYTDEVHLDADTVIPTLYVAKKYLIEYLIRACIDFLQNSLTSKNVCFLLSQSRLFEEEELVARCWEMIDAQAELALFSDSFWEVDFETLKLILSRETLNARESKIFEAAIRWAECECQRLKLEATPVTKRHLLGSAFHLIRFPAMKVEEFAVKVVNSGILTPEECVEIFMHHFSEKESQLPFPVSPRHGLPLKRCQRFQSSAYRNNQWRYRGRCDSIQFCTDRRIFIAGFGLFGSSNGSANLDTCFFSDGSSKIFPVFFEQPVQIEADVYYTAGIVLEGNELSYFGQEGMPEVQVHNRPSRHRMDRQYSRVPACLLYLDFSPFCLFIVFVLIKWNPASTRLPVNKTNRVDYTHQRVTVLGQAVVCPPFVAHDGRARRYTLPYGRNERNGRAVRHGNHLAVTGLQAHRRRPITVGKTGLGCTFSSSTRSRPLGR
uniref:BTB domain-containing protein n=1 Tax=Trichuris muris TaxID=70415 RepID=A0A5S6R451_TRIMR